ncbi:MAG: hypothetical protein V4625_09930 [Pseudomonadota bacterium]
MPPRRQFIALAIALLGSTRTSAQGSQVEYQVDLKARWGGTAHEGEVEAAPRKLIQMFGQPLLNDGDSESLGTYVFSTNDGTVLTLYRRAYDVSKQQVEALRADFWQQKQEVEFHIGAKRAHDVPQFKAWLVKRLAQR